MKWLDRGLLLFGIAAILGFSFLRDKPPPPPDNYLVERVTVLEAKVACWQTIHPKRCQ
jgi:hypothetical protein